MPPNDQAAAEAEGATAPWSGPPDTLPAGVEPQPELQAQSKDEAPPARGREADKKGPSTVPLLDLEVQPLPVLAPGTLVGERYEITSLLAARGHTNIYSVVDRQGYRRCWACGAESSMQDDMYCVECGAQLTGKSYRLQQLRIARQNGTDESVVDIMPVPEPLINNLVPGVVRVLDVIWAPDAGEAYIVWDEPQGRALSTWLPQDEAAGVPEAAEGQAYAKPHETLAEEQAAGWTAQAAEVLAHLHAHNIVGCAITLDNLVAQAGDGVWLVDPYGCRDASTLPEQQVAAMQASDVRALATELERWYLAVRQHDGTADTPAPMPEDGHAMVASIEEQTGPLDTPNLATLLAQAKVGAYATAQELAEALRDLHATLQPPRDLQLLSGRASDLGMVRQVNEDTVLTLEATALEEGGNLTIGLYVVADGMGGHQSGELASSIAARTIGSVVNSALLGPLLAGDPAAIDSRSCAALLREAVLEANRRISELARERHSDLGTTVVAALVIGNHVTVANVGDSRMYLWTGGRLKVITRDHSLVAQLVETGQLAPEDIYTHPRRNEIYRALGDARLDVEEVDVFIRTLQPGDAILLCSDGLWDYVRDPQIAGILADHQHAHPQEACAALVQAANAQGGEDNISVVLVRAIQSRNTGNTGNTG
jgi:protein phosphatase